MGNRFAKTLYVNTKTPQGVETIDQFTRGENAPKKSSEFKRYVESMIAEYQLAGIAAYASRRCAKAWKER